MNRVFIFTLVPFYAFISFITLILFYIDLFLLTFFHTFSISSLIAFTLVQFLYQRFSYFLFLNLVLIALYGFVATGLVIPYLSFFIIISCLAKLISFYSLHRFVICSSAMTLITLYPLLSSPFLGLTYPLYTSLVITGNLILIYFSLKWFPAVKRSNRS